MDVISNFAARYERTREEEISIEDYLAECKRNPLAYASAAERMLKAIGEPKMIASDSAIACSACRAISCMMPSLASGSKPPVSTTR